MRTLIIDESFNPSQLTPEFQKLYSYYLNAKDRCSEFKNILHLKLKNTQLFIQKCIELCKSIKCLSFRKDKLRFEIRITRNKKRIYLGSYDDFDEALKCLRIYIQNS